MISIGKGRENLSTQLAPAVTKFTIFKDLVGGDQGGSCLWRGKGPQTRRGKEESEDFPFEKEKSAIDAES